MVIMLNKYRLDRNQGGDVSVDVGIDR